MRRWGSQPFSWTYLGQRIDESRLTQQTLGESGSCVDTSQRFQEAAESLRDPYLSYLYEIGHRLNNLRWWLTSLSYRSAYMSRTFQQACYLKVALKLVADWEGPGYLIIVVGDPPLRHALKSNIVTATGIKVQMVGGLKSSPFRSYRDRLNMLAHRGFFLYRETLRVFWARRLLPAPQTAGERTTLLMSWVHSRNIGSGSEFHRFSFGDLTARLGELGYKVATVPMILRDVNYRDTLLRLQSSPIPMLVPHRYLRFRDVLWAVIASCGKPPVPDPVPLFAGMDISSLVKEDLRTHWIRNQAADALLIVALVRRWASVGASIVRIIYLYENQPWERALCWQVRRSLPNSKLVGYQNGRVPRLLLNWHLAPGEENEAPLPDKVVTGGSYAACQLRSGRYKSGCLQLGGALEMLDFLALRSQVNSSTATVNGVSVLVAPSYGREEAAELVDLASRLFDKGQRFPIVIKCHPLMPFNRVADLLGRPLPNHVEVSDEPTTDLMLKSSVMVYTSSTICVQAMALGLPAVHLRPQFELDMDPLESTPDARLEASGLDELRQRVLWILITGKNISPSIASGGTAWWTSSTSP